MLIKLVGSPEETQELRTRVDQSLDTLGLSDAVQIDTTNNQDYRDELGIKQDPALCIEEESIQFKDMIFEGVTPEVSELSSMFLSIFG